MRSSKASRTPVALREKVAEGRVGRDAAAVQEPGLGEKECAGAARGKQRRVSRKRRQPGDEAGFVRQRLFDVVEDGRDQHDIAVACPGERAVRLDRMSAVAFNRQPARGDDFDVVAGPARVVAAAGCDGKSVGLTVHGRRHAAFECDDGDLGRLDCMARIRRKPSIILPRYICRPPLSRGRSTASVRPWVGRRAT